MERQCIGTSLGAVEVAVCPGDLDPVLFFPGGHCTAAADCGWSMFRRLGHAVVSFSRPGYGATRVGDLTASEFVPAIEDVCATLRLSRIAAAVGVSFGGMEAVHAALSPALDVDRLVLCSAAPSTLPFPDSRREALFGPMIFGPRVERLTWAGISRLVRTERGLAMLAGTLSTRPLHEWWGDWTPQDRSAVRELFLGMSSGSGFATDVRQATPSRARTRHRSLSLVRTPTLVLGSRSDAGVSFRHAEDLAATIPGARLVETAAQSHLYWLGPVADEVAHEIERFMDGQA